MGLIVQVGELNGGNGISPLICLPSHYQVTFVAAKCNSLFACFASLRATASQPKYMHVFDLIIFFEKWKKKKMMKGLIHNSGAAMTAEFMKHFSCFSDSDLKASLVTFFSTLLC